MRSQKRDATATDAEAELTAHVLSRVGELRAALEASPEVHVTIAGSGGQSSLGRGVAAKQWRDRFGEDGVRGHERLLAVLDAQFSGLARDYPTRVRFGVVRGDAAAEAIMVWGANAGNWNLRDGTCISGSGQAAAMGVQKPGPGSSELSQHHCAGVLGAARVAAAADATLRSHQLSGSPPAS